MKVGDLVRWKEHGKWLGIVLKTKPPESVNPAVLAYIPECPEPEWIPLGELELINESR
jgi:hypothetical protein